MGNAGQRWRWGAPIWPAAVATPPPRGRAASGAARARLPSAPPITLPPCPRCCRATMLGWRVQGGGAMWGGAARAAEAAGQTEAGREGGAWWGQDSRGLVGSSLGSSSRQQHDHRQQEGDWRRGSVVLCARREQPSRPRCVFEGGVGGRLPPYCWEASPPAAAAAAAEGGGTCSPSRSARGSTRIMSTNGARRPSSHRCHSGCCITRLYPAPSYS